MICQAAEITQIPDQDGVSHKDDPAFSPAPPKPKRRVTPFPFLTEPRAVNEVALELDPSLVAALQLTAESNSNPDSSSGSDSPESFATSTPSESLTTSGVLVPPNTAASPSSIVLPEASAVLLEEVEEGHAQLEEEHAQPEEAEREKKLTMWGKRRGREEEGFVLRKEVPQFGRRKVRAWIKRVFFHQEVKEVKEEEEQVNKEQVIHEQALNHEQINHEQVNEIQHPAPVSAPVPTPPISPSSFTFSTAHPNPSSAPPNTRPKLTITTTPIPALPLQRAMMA